MTDEPFPKPIPCCPVCQGGDKPPHVAEAGSCCCFHTPPVPLPDE